MTHSTHEKSMQDILEKLRDPSNNDPAALYTQIEKLRALLADALSKSGAIDDKTRAMVISARETFDAFHSGGFKDVMNGRIDALDKALEPFSAMVPYADEPDAPEFIPGSIDARGWYMDQHGIGHRVLATKYRLEPAFEDAAREWGWYVHQRIVVLSGEAVMFVTRSETAANEAERRMAAESGYMAGGDRTDDRAAPKIESDVRDYINIPQEPIPWGNLIAVDGKRPDWLADDDLMIWVGPYRNPSSWSGVSRGGMKAGSLNWDGAMTGGEILVADIRLHADHPYYVATSRGFTYWPGGDVEPDDFDHSNTILLRDGREFQPLTNVGLNWSHDQYGMGISDIIGYHRKAEADPEFAEVCSCPEGGWSEDCLEHPLPPTMPDNAFEPYHIVTQTDVDRTLDDLQVIIDQGFDHLSGDDHSNNVRLQGAQELITILWNAVNSAKPKKIFAQTNGQIAQAIDDAINDGWIGVDDAAVKNVLSTGRRAQRDAFAMAAAPFILGKFFGAVDYGDLVVHLFDFADTCLSESEKRAKGDAA